MANLNLSNFIIDRILSGVGYATDGSVYFKMDQCQDTSITCGSEATEIVDNVGAPVMTLYRAKTCEISGQNAILDMNLTAFQMGTTKTVAGSGTSNVIVAAGEYVGSTTDVILPNTMALPMDEKMYNVLYDANIAIEVDDANSGYSDFGLTIRDFQYDYVDYESPDRAFKSLYYTSTDDQASSFVSFRFVVEQDIMEPETIIAPAVEVITVPDDYVVELSHTPIATPKYIYILNNDGSLGDSYDVGVETSSDSTFLIVGNVLELPSAMNVGDQVFISYEYETTAGIEIVNSAKNFPKSCKLVLKALGYNPCEKDNKLACYIIFPSFEMSPDFDLSLQAGETQAWSGKASQDYCSKDKRLMSIVVVDEDDEMF